MLCCSQDHYSFKFKKINGIKSVRIVVKFLYIVLSKEEGRCLLFHPDVKIIERYNLSIIHMEENISHGDKYQRPIQGKPTLRKSSRGKKPNPKCADYFDEIHRKRVKDDFDKSAKKIDILLVRITSLNVTSNRAEVQLEFNNMAVEWQNFERARKEYIAAVDYTSELQDVTVRRQELLRKICVSRKIFMSTLDAGKPETLTRDSQQSKIDDHLSDICLTNSASSGRSSTSCKARLAARSARIAKLRLEQAAKRSKLKQKQNKELAELGKARVKLESRRAEAELEERLQDLKDAAECAQCEVELMAAEEGLETGRDHGIGGDDKKREIQVCPLKIVLRLHLMIDVVC